MYMQLLFMLHPTSVTRLCDLLDFGQVFKPLATINLPKSPTFLCNFCKDVKINHFSSEIFLGQLLKTLGNFFLVTLHSASQSKPANGLTKIFVISDQNADRLPLPTT